MLRGWNIINWCGKLYFRSLQGLLISIFTLVLNSNAYAYTLVCLFYFVSYRDILFVSSLERSFFFKAFVGILRSVSSIILFTLFGRYEYSCCHYLTKIRFSYNIDDRTEPILMVFCVSHLFGICFTSLSLL